MRTTALGAKLAELRKFGATMYRETGKDGVTWEVQLGPLPVAAKKADEKPAEEPQEERYPKDAATLALKLVGNR